LLFGIGVAALVVVLGVFGAYLLLRPKAPAAAEAALPVAPAPAADTDPAAERQRLLASIAQLDDLYASGGLDEESYQRARAAQKRSLLLVAGARSEIGNHPGGTGPSVEVGMETGPSGEAGAVTGPSAEARADDGASGEERSEQ
jgi:hypothetical protein